MDPKEIKESKARALSKIKEILDGGNVDEQFKNRSGNYYSNEKFIVTWFGNYKGMLCEFGLDKCDEFYKMYSGYAGILCVRNLVFERQKKGFPTIEFGLLRIGLDLSRTKEEKLEFFNKYVVPYNERLKQQHNEA